MTVTFQKIVKTLRTKKPINQNLNNTAKATKKIRDDGKRCKEVIYGKIEQKTKA